MKQIALGILSQVDIKFGPLPGSYAHQACSQEESIVCSLTAAPFFIFGRRAEALVYCGPWDGNTKARNKRGLTTCAPKMKRTKSHAKGRKIS